MIHGKRARPIQKDGTLQRFLLGGLGPAPPVGQPWVHPPGGSTRKAHAAFATGCAPYLTRRIHGASDCPSPNHGALQRLPVLVGGLGPAPPVGRPARRLHSQGTCDILIGPGPGSDASNPRRKRRSEPQRRGPALEGTLHSLPFRLRTSYLLARPLCFAETAAEV
jgi:hypothetical protein